ncbi:hypothetical protein ACM64Y_12225 [Novispirillum sp. DQ9]|uniref:O-linked N-acetylglucosamine transferase, SPINDLY family protein n=1 Tax=Novispirillum sp. DQ9 TaxID=3398612 RepID=UPI003C7AE1FD
MITGAQSDRLGLAFAAYRQGDLMAARQHCADLLEAGAEQVVEALFLLAVVEAAAGDTETAQGLFRQVIAQRPDVADAYVNLAALLVRRGFARLDDPRGAGADFRLALALAPGAAAAWRGLGHVHRMSGRPAEAARAYARAHCLEPAVDAVAGERLFAHLCAADWAGAAPLRQRLETMMETDGGMVLPLLSLLIPGTPAGQRRAAARFYRDEIASAPSAPPVPALPAAAPRHRLTIAYLSGDFHDHATAYLVAELFELHDRSRFRVLAGSYGPDDGGAMRRRLVRGVDGFHDIGGLSRDAVAAWMAAEGVDILVDLKGYTQGARLDLLARRMAPIQVAYLGYPGTMGDGPMDYLIGDPVVTPADHQPWYSEHLVILPDCYQVNDRQRPLPAAPADRTACGLPATGFVFGALHAPHKITPELFGLWMRLLGAVPGSCLWLFDPHGAAADTLRRAAAGHGIEPERLVFAGALPLADHLARLRLIDLALDSFPYNGHTTTSDALWMGVPVVTVMGQGFASRVAASLLRAVGMAELVSASMADHEALALTLARQPDRLRALRQRLEAARGTAPLFDTPRFARHLERAYRMMWDRHAAGLPPEGFSVPPS